MWLAAHAVSGWAVVHPVLNAPNVLTVKLPPCGTAMRRAKEHFGLAILPHLEAGLIEALDEQPLPCRSLRLMSIRASLISTAVLSTTAVTTTLSTASASHPATQYPGCVTDACGVCNEWDTHTYTANSSCTDCSGEVFGMAQRDAYGTCGGDNSSLVNAFKLSDSGARSRPFFPPCNPRTRMRPHALSPHLYVPQAFRRSSGRWS